MKLVIASSNTGKLAELHALLDDSGIELLTQASLGIDDAEETGTTFVENALLKARKAARESGLPALGDDSGLCVDALDGAPGLYSARYAGGHGDADANIDKLLRQLHGLPDAGRGARFHCVVVVLRHADDPQPIIAEGSWHGRILDVRRGTGGFGYDPVFLDVEHGQTAAEMDSALKNRISHRGQALVVLSAPLQERTWARWGFAGKASRAQVRSYNMHMLIPPPLSLYIHLPWCVRKCPYCDFNSHERKGALPFDAYVEALIADLDFDLPQVWGRTVNSVFFGGGTPSLFPPEAVDRILQAARARLRFAPNLEITLETNPGTAEHGRFEGYRDAGVNRLSFGVQSFDDGCLQRLGRIHDSDEAVRAIALAQDAGFDNVNLDLMYALPQQTLAMAQRDIERALERQPAHISHYQLTLEPNTVFAARPPAQIPDEDAAWDMQERCQAMLADAGYAQYEISAYARPGRQCAHNLNYWRFGDYLGIGAGAHGKISSGAEQSILRRWKVKHPSDYLLKAGTPQMIGGDELIDDARRPFDYMLNALRLAEGFSLRAFESRTGLPRSAIDIPLARALENDWLTLEGEDVMPTERGHRFNNDVIGLFLGA